MLFRKKKNENQNGKELLKKQRKQVDRALIFMVVAIIAAIPAAFLLLKLLRNPLGAGLFIILLIITHQPEPPMPPADEVFRQYVLDPVPASVTNIKADQPRRPLAYTFTLRFDIDRDDVGLLVKHLSMKRVWNVKYEKGYLEWAWDTWQGRSMGGVSIIVYRSGQREPKWFEPQQWNQPEAYVFEEKTRDGTKHKILLYNERKGEAYFVAQNWMN